MTVVRHLLIALAFLLAPGPAQAETGPDSLRFDVVTPQDWDVVAFVNFANEAEGTSLHPDIALRNAGWTNRYASTPSRNFHPGEDDPNTLRFDVTWYEVATGDAFEATVEVDGRDVHADPVMPEFGTLLLRIARGGHIEAVTYDDPYPPAPETQTEPIRLAFVCGTQIPLSDIRTKEIARLLDDPLNRDPAGPEVEPTDIPSDCE